MIGFDLIDGGLINLAGGVGTLQLNSIGSNTLVDLRSLPISAGTTNPSPTSPVETLQFVETSNGGTELAGFGGYTVPGSGSGISAQVNPKNVTTIVGAGGQVQVLSGGGRRRPRSARRRGSTSWSIRSTARRRTPRCSARHSFTPMTPRRTC